MTEIYFDNNATTKLNAQVIEVMNETFQHSLNASATHNLGRKAQNIVEESRQDLQNLLNAGNYEVTFTASGTEANNMALFGSQVDEILFCTIEHSSIFNARPDCKITEIKSLKTSLAFFPTLAYTFRFSYYFTKLFLLGKISMERMGYSTHFNGPLVNL